MFRALYFVCGLLLLCCTLPVLAAAPARLYYTGVMDGKYPLQMELAWTTGNSITGHYRFESSAEPLYLLGKMLAWRKASFSEYHGLHDREAVFGIFTGQFSADWRTFTGDWTSGAGKRHLLVTLAAVAEYQSLSRDNPRLSGTYPVFFSPSPAQLQLSQLLREEILSANQPNQHASISLVYFRPDQVSLLSEGHAGPVDKPREWSASSTTYRLDAGGVHQLALDDLFDPHKPYMDKLIRLATANLSKQAGQRPSAAIPAALTAASMTIYTISDKAITFIFVPEKADPQQAPVSYVAIPFAQLTDCLNPEGALYNRLMTAIHLVTRDPLTGLTAAEAMRLGSDKFVTCYWTKSKDASEEGTRKALGVYRMLLYTRNNLLANALPADRQGQFQQAEALLERLLDAHYAALAARNGFGTMQLDLRASATAEREEVLAKVLAGLHEPQTNPAARAAAVKALLAVDTRFAWLAHVQPQAEQPADFQRAQQTLQQVVAELKTLLPTLPDTAAQSLGEYARTYMKLED